MQNSSHMRCADTAMACSPLNWNFLFVWPVARNRRQVPAPPPPPRSQASQAARGPLRLRSTPRAPSAPSASTSFSASHLPAPARRATRPAPRRQHLPPHPRAVRPSPPAGHTPRAPSAPGAPTLLCVAPLSGASTGAIGGGVPLVHSGAYQHGAARTVRIDCEPTAVQDCVHSKGRRGQRGRASGAAVCRRSGAGSGPVSGTSHDRRLSTDVLRPLKAVARRDGGRGV